MDRQLLLQHLLLTTSASIRKKSISEGNILKMEKNDKWSEKWLAWFRQPGKKIKRPPLNTFRKINQLKRPFWPRNRNRTSSSPGLTARQSKSGLTSYESCFVEHHPKTIPRITQTCPLPLLPPLLRQEQLKQGNTNSSPAATDSCVIPNPAQHHPTPDIRHRGCRGSTWSWGGGRGDTNAQQLSGSPPAPAAPLSRGRCAVSWGQGNQNQSLPGKWVKLNAIRLYLKSTAKNPQVPFVSPVGNGMHKFHVN